MSSRRAPRSPARSVFAVADFCRSPAGLFVCELAVDAIKKHSTTVSSSSLYTSHRWAQAYSHDEGAVISTRARASWEINTNYYNCFQVCASFRTMTSPT